jgi:hypothetical protein
VPHPTDSEGLKRNPYSELYKLIFSIDYSYLVFLVPPKGSLYGWDERNGHLGSYWQSMSPDEQLVFDLKIFFHFSMIPIPYDGEDKEVEDEDESTVNKQDLLTKEEDCKY